MVIVIPLLMCKGKGKGTGLFVKRLPIKYDFAYTSKIKTLWAGPFIFNNSVECQWHAYHDLTNS